jgi:CBS domain-containing protein
MKPAPEAISDTTPLAEALERMRRAGTDDWPVTGKRGFRAMIGPEAVARALESAAPDAPLATIVTDAANDGDPEASCHVHPDQPIGTALSRMGAAGVAVLPVVSRRNVRQLLGVVTLHDVLSGFGLEGLGGEDWHGG